MAAETGRVFVAKSPEVFSYDADGNLLQDGRFNYAWDCENRLIGVETRAGALPGNVPRIKVEMKYDYLGRRVGKQVWEMRGQWSLLSSQVMVYDGWNLIREETTASGTGKIVDEYIWGLDLSGSLQGAGGVGGLLCRQRMEERYYDGQGKLIICHHPPRNPEQPKTIRINENIWPLHEAHGDTLGACEGPNVTNSSFFYTYDGNGNVSELLLSSVVGPPSSVAHYEYSPFGETIVSIGPEAQDNPIRFSTKYWDSETSLSYYGYRHYSPSLGRWLSRDPMEEEGGLNIYAAMLNSVVNSTDVLGKFGQLLHFLRTRDWAEDAGFESGYAAIIGDADNGLDSGATGPWPGQQQDRHMLYLAGGDSRDRWYKREYDEAVKSLNRGEVETNPLDCIEAARAFGRGLHSLQDKAAHRPWPEGGNWHALTAHPIWWDDWYGQVNSGESAPFSEMFWRNFNRRPDYYIWDGQADQVQSQNAARRAAQEGSVGALENFAEAVRDTCFCRVRMMAGP